MKKDIWNGLPIVVFGTSGISKEVKCIIDEINSKNYEKQYDFIGYIDENIEKVGELFYGDKIVACDSNFKEFCSNYTQIGVIIPIGNPQIKENIYNQLCGYNNVIYPNIISPSAKIMDPSRVKLGMGNIVASGVTLTTDIEIGKFNLININCTVGHDVIIKDYCVVNPLTSVSGNVTINSSVLLGAGSSIKQGLSIGKNSIVGLGAFVVKDVEERVIMVCQSARELNLKNK